MKFTAAVLKWVGAATAVISLIVGAREVITIITDRAERNRESAQRSRESAELVALARQQAGRGEFAAAWKSLDRAEEKSPTGAISEARLDIGFRWLQESHPDPGQPFSTITNVVVPALDRALLDEQHPRRADILAHLGWATFLKRRDTGSGDPAPLYEQALAVDPHNVYANAMLAHWLLLQGASLDTARSRFDAALATGKEHALVRTFQLSALQNRNNDAGDGELIRVVDAMRRQNEDLDVRSARSAYSAFSRRYGPRAVAGLRADVDDIPAAERLATFAWLARMPGVAERVETTDYVTATLKAASTGTGATASAPATSR
jgi:hypothetical protein